MKVFYTRPVSLFNTPQCERDIILLESLGFEVLDPNNQELNERYKIEEMGAFGSMIADADVIAFRSFPDLKISSGVAMQIKDSGLPVIELPTITDTRVLSRDDTRAYLGYIGKR